MKQSLHVRVNFTASVLAIGLVCFVPAGCRTAEPISATALTTPRSWTAVRTGYVNLWQTVAAVNPQELWRIGERYRTSRTECVEIRDAAGSRKLLLSARGFAAFDAELLDTAPPGGRPLIYLHGGWILYADRSPAIETDRIEVSLGFDDPLFGDADSPDDQAFAVVEIRSPDVHRVYLLPRRGAARLNIRVKDSSAAPLVLMGLADVYVETRRTSAGTYELTDAASLISSNPQRPAIDRLIRFADTAGIRTNAAAAGPPEAGPSISPPFGPSLEEFEFPDLDDKPLVAPSPISIEPPESAP